MQAKHLHFGSSISIALFALAFLVILGGQQPLQAQGGPTLNIRAPKQVEVGQPIKITLRLRRASNIAGYEINVRYDSNAAHLSGVRQRNNGLKKLGREVVPLQVEQPGGGVAIGLASCNVSDCVRGEGAKQEQGGSGKLLLATLFIGSAVQGPLEIRFDSAKFVDVSGAPVEVAIPRLTITVQVGQGGDAHPAPPSTWQLANAAGHAPAVAEMDRTHDQQVTFGDVMEYALAWTDTRLSGSPCANLPDPALDLNRDGCIDVADVQIAAANVTTARLPEGTAALTFTVNTTNDAADTTPGDGVCNATGGCTLRAAIDESNAHPGPDNIVFNIPGSGVQIINLKTNLPTLSDSTGGTTIDAYTQPGATVNNDPLASNAQIKIQLNGQGANSFDAFRITAANNVVRGLAIYNLRRSFFLYGAGASDNLIAGNFVGTDAAGQFEHTVTVVSGSGVQLEVGAKNNRIGTPALADRNVISGNSRHGIATHFEGTNGNVIQNNILGLAPLGDRRLKNFFHGIDLNSGTAGTIIGGTGANERNVISGVGDLTASDSTAAVEISHDTLTVQNKVLGNCIGTDLTCNSAPAFARLVHYGIRLEDGVNSNEVGYNVVVNAPLGGIRMDNFNVINNSVHDNRIGVTANGTPAPNVAFGILVKYHAQRNTIGPNNIIANSPTGILVEYLNEDFNTITRNSIYDNSAFGIDLGPSTGVSYNDAGDTDSGANEGLNYPVLTSATQFEVKGTACGEAVVPKPCTIEVFLAQPNPSDLGGGQFGQGKTLVGTGSSNGSFTINVSGLNVGDFVTATATDAQGNTSEFSKNIQVAPATGPTPTPAPTLPPPTPTPPGSTTYVQDSFSRTVTNSWGTADLGGAYSLSSTPANFDVNGAEGSIRINITNTVRSAWLLGVSALDVDETFRVKTDKVAQNGSQIAYFIARRVGSTTNYLGRVRFAPDGSIRVQATAEVNGVQTLLGGEKVLSGVTQTANTYYWLRGQVVGTNPTTIRLKIWVDGQPEPSTWLYSATDSTAALQAPGSVGVRVYLATQATNAPVIFTFDDYRVRSAP